MIVTMTNGNNTPIIKGTPKYIPLTAATRQRLRNIVPLVEQKKEESLTYSQVVDWLIDQAVLFKALPESIPIKRDDK